MKRAASLAAIALIAAAQALAAAPASKASAPVGGKAASAASAGVATALPSAPVDFEGTLESGKTYVAEVAWDNNALHIWRPTRDVKVPTGHAWTIDWTNLAQFPTLKTTATRARPQRFQFRVAGVDVSNGSPMIPWTTIYHCEVIAVEAVAGAPSPGAKRK